MSFSSDSKKFSAFRAPANALYRSHIEICRILNELAHASHPIYAEVGEEKLFVTRILQVDEASGWLVIEYGEDKSINSVLFDQHWANFRVSYLGAHLAFRVYEPQDILLEDRPAIRFYLPHTLLWSQRREHPRVVVPPHVPLRCVFRNADGEFVKTDIFDISLDGMGGMICEGNDNLEVGSVLRDCRITYPGGEPVSADLVVRNVKTIARSDGSFFKRIGVRFVQRPEEIHALVDFFIHDLDSEAT